MATFTSRSYDAAKRLLRQARAAACKPIVADFCHHIGLDEYEVTAALNPPLRRAA